MSSLAGDPTFLGWATALAYVAAALLAGMATRASAVSRRETRFWWGAFVVLLALGLNKELDLQVAFMHHARDLSWALGLYPWYGKIRVALIGCTALAVATGLAWLARHLRTEGAPLRYAVAGFALLGLYVVLRVTTFYEVDRRFGFDTSLHDMVWIVEAAGIALAGGAAGWRILRR